MKVVMNWISGWIAKGENNLQRRVKTAGEHTKLVCEGALSGLLKQPATDYSKEE